MRQIVPPHWKHLTVTAASCLQVRELFTCLDAFADCVEVQRLRESHEVVRPFRDAGVIGRFEVFLIAAVCRTAPVTKYKDIMQVDTSHGIYSCRGSVAGARHDWRGRHLRLVPWQSAAGATPRLGKIPWRSQ